MGPENSPTAAGVEPAEPIEEARGESAGEQLVVEDLLVEDVSIDGMCGVY